MMRSVLWRQMGVLVSCLVMAGPVWADEITEPTTTPATEALMVAGPHERVANTSRPPLPFGPTLDWPTLCWLGAALVLVLTVRLNPATRWRNVDALVLAGVCILLALRDSTQMGVGWRGHTWEWWAYAGLTLAAVYWLLRGFGLLVGNRPIEHPGLISPGARAALLLVAVALAGYQLKTAPLSSAAQDGVIGGLYFNATGYLPHGFVAGHDSRTPLLYLAHAAVLRALPVSVPDADTGTLMPLTWGNYENWKDGDWITAGDLTAPRLVGYGLYVLLVLGIATLGLRLQGGAAGWTLAALVSVFPGTLECLGHHDVMLGAVLLTWALALAFVPALGGLLATALIVLAGVAWPWLWLTLPLFLALALRRGLQGLGAIVGLGGAVAGVVAALLYLVAGAPPREDGALRIAGEVPGFSAQMVDQGAILIEPLADFESPDSKAWTRWGWKLLLQGDEVQLERATRFANIHLGSSVEPQVRFRDLRMAPEVRVALSGWYREQVAELPPLERLRVQTRTLLEATWLPAQGVVHPVPGVWALWGHDHPERATLARRILKLAGGLLALWATFAIFFGNRVLPRHLLGGVLLLVTCGLLVTALGPVTHLVWLAVPVAALWAVFDVPTGSRTGHRVPMTTTQTNMPRSGATVLGGPAPSSARVTVEGPAAQS
ncbi:MAG: hypothetical protein IPM18_07815 [Phycisphaerales bacterium]|nr:hypothetical protein [Phycisphaerales bacterium]